MAYFPYVESWMSRSTYQVRHHLLTARHPAKILTRLIRTRTRTLTLDISDIPRIACRGLLFDLMLSGGLPAVQGLFEVAGHLGGG